MFAFIDFDDTLLDAHTFDREYFGIFEQFGVPFEKVSAAYQAVKHEIGYDAPPVHLRFLKQQYPKLPIQKLTQLLNNHRLQSSRFIFSDALPFFSYLRKKHAKIYIVSTGYPPTQHKKIYSCGLERFFDGVHVIKNKDKASRIAKILKNRKEDFIFIDDKKYFVEHVKEQLPWGRVFQILRRKNQEKSDRVDAVVHNLEDAISAIEYAQILKI